MNRLTHSLASATAVAACWSTLTACDDDKPAPNPTSSASAAAVASASATPRKPRPSFVRAGPLLPLVPGKGAGPILFGASVETIERIMKLPCDEKTATRCRYIPRAVEFFFQDGKLVKIHAHRVYRLAGKDKLGDPMYYGIFNGVVLPDVQLTMVRSELIKQLGSATKVEQKPAGGPHNTRELHHYPGMTVEIDELPNKKRVLGGIILTTTTGEAKATPSASPSAGK